MTLAYEFLEDSYEETLQRLSITQTAYRYNPYILIACAHENEEYTRTMLAKASNSLLEVSTIKATFTIGRISKTMVAISARSTRDINVQIIMENMGVRISWLIFARNSLLALFASIASLKHCKRRDILR